MERSIALKFHEKTELTKCNTRKYNSFLFKKIFYKSYPRFPKIKLPLNINTTSFSFEEILLKRRSIRKFKRSWMTLGELSYILYFSGGISYKGKNWDEAYRMYPSAGARYPLEIYLLVIRVKNTLPGIYHYNVKKHSLELLAKYSINDLNKMMRKIYCNQELTKNPSVILIITAVFERTMLKYGERGYRYILLDVGHFAQNVYLTATAIGIGCCTIGGFLDKEITKLLDLERVGEKPMYSIALGKI